MLIGKGITNANAKGGFMVVGKQIWALGGESICAPEDTLPAYWGALGAGAHGLIVSLQITSDGAVVCCRRGTLEEVGGGPKTVNEVSSEVLRKLDAGTDFRSTTLDASNQPIGKGDDMPWEGVKTGRIPLYHPELGEMLLIFSRRTSLMFHLLPPAKGDKRARERLVDAALAKATRFGLIGSAIWAGDKTTLALVKKANKNCVLAYVPRKTEKILDAATAARGFGAAYLLADAERIVSRNRKTGTGLTKALGKTTLVIVTSNEMPYALTPTYYSALRDAPWVCGFACRAVLETAGMGMPPYLVVEDDFAGKTVNRQLWTMGYSKPNQDTKISQNNGLIIQIKDGGEYSGAAALTSYSIHGDFDAQVSFEVANPQQGTTFELAAIQVDPGYHHPENSDLTRKSVNLTFDVHGAPPYASSERDEDDGFRIGTNNGPAVTQFVRDLAQSSNIYNKYSRDVGDGTKDNPEGQLRLVRHGYVFNAYYKDKHNEQWILSGSQSVPTLCHDVYLRLGAKHWPKRGRKPPRNRVVFRDFRLY